MKKLVFTTLFSVASLVATGLILPSHVAHAVNALTWSCAETQLTIPQNSFVKSAETDRYSARVTYLTPAGAENVLIMPLDYTFKYVYGLYVYGDAWQSTFYENGPFIYTGSMVSKDGTYYIKSATAWRIQYLKDKWIKEFQAVRFECDYITGGWHFPRWGTQWQVKTNVSGVPPETQQTQPPQPGGNENGGGGQQSAAPKEFEGFISSLGTASVTLNKEGELLQLTTSSQTIVTLNGQSAPFGNLLIRDKVKAVYDPNTNEAFQLKAER